MQHTKVFRKIYKYTHYNPLMRYKIKFTFKDELKLPIHYNHLIQGLIYSHISNVDERNRIHDYGFMVGAKKIKLMTFSKIFGLYNIDKNYIIFKPPVELIFASYYDEISSEIAYNLLADENIFLNSTKINVIDIKSHSFDDEKYKNIKYYMIEMISPLTVYITQNNHRKTFFSPWSPEFENAISNNISTKFSAISNNRNFLFNIRPNNIKNNKDEKVIYFKDTLIKGYNGIFTLKTDSEVMKMLYYTGIGSKNSEGFGCFNILGDKI